MLIENKETDMAFVFLFLCSLTSFCVTVSKSIHISTNDPVLFLLMAKCVICCVYVPHLLYPFIWRKSI